MTAEPQGVVPSGPGRWVAIDPVHPGFGPLLDAALTLRRGGLVAYPTETFYGLGADPFDAAAVERLFALKGRPSSSPLILLLSHPGQLLDLARPTGLAKEWQEKLARAFWPGPLTLVLPARASLRCPALAGGDTVAVRLSPHPVAWQLARTAALPITSTSANLTGAPPVASASSLDPALASRLDLVLDAGSTPGGLASTLLDLTGERPILLRRGAITGDQIAAAIGLSPRIASHLSDVA